MSREPEARRRPSEKNRWGYHDVYVEAHEVKYAEWVGRLRNAARLKAGSRPLKAAETLEANKIGALGELVVAKYLGIYWYCVVGPTDKDSGDVAGYQVRTTARPDGSLIFRPGRDREADAYVLVHLADLPLATIVGWCYGHEAAHLGTLRQPDGAFKPAYFVKPERLHDWDTRPPARWPDVERPA